MDAAKFVKESVRMCGNYHCDDCPAGSVNHPCIIADATSLADDDKVLEKYIAMVEKWSAEHPVVTNLDKMVEIFGDETVAFLETYLRFICTDMPFKKEASAWLGEEYKDVDKK